jgi:hypothetical protein
LSYPELYSDERVVLQAQNVKVKSVSFELVLTTRRLVLIDTKKGSIPPQEINLATLKDVESGENAIRDPTITISIITISGNTRQMVLTFSKTSGGERRRECDDWVKALRLNITSTVYHPVTQVPTLKEQEPAPAAKPPAPAPHRIDVTSTQPPKKRIEIARPMSKIVEAAPAMPVPVETTSLPTGSFCNRCGNRVPPESVFCNHCGTPIVQGTGWVSLPLEETGVPLQQPAQDVQQVQITPSPLSMETAEKKDRPIEDVIHSIEPLIEDSVPRTSPAPLVPAKQVHSAPPSDVASPAGKVPTSADSGFFAAAAQPAEVQWPILQKSAIPDAQAPPDAPVAPLAAASVPPTPPGKTSITMIAVLALAILAVIAGVYFFMQGQAGTPGITPTLEITVPATTVPQTMVTVVTKTVKPTATLQQVTTPSFLIPKSGVWVRITYPNKFEGTVGMPGRLMDVTNSGDHIYPISTDEGPVVVSIQKSDGTSARLSVDIYKDGTVMKHAETITPKGIIELQVSLKPVAAATT